MNVVGSRYKTHKRAATANVKCSIPSPAMKKAICSLKTVVEDVCVFHNLLMICRPRESNIPLNVPAYTWLAINNRPYSLYVVASRVDWMLFGLRLLIYPLWPSVFLGLYFLFTSLKSPAKESAKAKKPEKVCSMVDTTFNASKFIGCKEQSL